MVLENECRLVGIEPGAKGPRLGRKSTSPSGLVAFILPTERLVYFLRSVGPVRIRISLDGRESDSRVRVL